MLVKGETIVVALKVVTIEVVAALLLHRFNSDLARATQDFAMCAMANWKTLCSVADIV